MQRNIDLLKRIALAAAELTNGGNDPLYELEDVSPQEFYMHAKLMCDTNLVEAKFMLDPDGGPIAAIVRLTLSDHEFLDICQNDTVWNKVRARWPPWRPDSSGLHQVWNTEAPAWRRSHVMRRVHRARRVFARRS